MAQSLPFQGFDEETALRIILEGTAAETGDGFFSALVKNLAQALNTYGAWVTEYVEESQRLRALAFWLDGQWLNDFEYDVTGTPCETAIKETRLVHIPDRILELYQGNPDLKDLRQSGVVSYLGVPLFDIDEKILGHMAVLDTRPMPEEPRSLAIFQIFAARAAAELQRLRVESQVKEREKKLGRLIDSAMDAVIELDQNLKVTMINPAAEKLFGYELAQIIGLDFEEFLLTESWNKINLLIEELNTLPEGRKYMWIPGGLRVKSIRVKSNGVTDFPAEATLSSFEMNRETFYTLILRDVNERLEAEKKIRALTFEAEYLKEEIDSLHNFNQIVGVSESLMKVLKDCKRVSNTDATVLVLGETGTGKELIARAIHAESDRGEKPLIKVNCAAIPANLIESELFGHEKGAFTGATEKRVGRFSLADGGSIFLDEIGELPVELQVKLLRVLQEGEFEPVGSSKTKKVDVRVIAATNRDLKKEVQEVNFRSDLYYRLNVFPISIPPLRERKEDIEHLVNHFIEKHSKNLGKNIDSISPEAMSVLISYNWPGNVRELENVIERAVILTRESEIKAVDLPDIDANTETSGSKTLEDVERSQILSVLDEVDWVIEGDNGAASVLDINPGTLRSRMKKLGITRPQ